MAQMMGNHLRTDRLVTGHRRLVRPIVTRSRGHSIVVPSGFDTDFSSYPRTLLIVGLALTLWWLDASPLWVLLLLLVPEYQRADIAGVVHDWLFMTQEYSWWETNLIWWDIARSGQTRVGWLQGIAGLGGLLVGSGVVWLKWKHKRASPHYMELIKKSKMIRG